MIALIDPRTRKLPTPGLISLASRPAIARQAVVEARKAEGEGQLGEAAKNFGRALTLLEKTSWASPLVTPTRAAAAAGLTRLEPHDPQAESWRREALAWLEHTAEHELDAADIADHALLLEAGDPLRRRLAAQAAVAPRPLASLAAKLVEDAMDPTTSSRLAWSAVREAPQVPLHHVLVAELDGRSDEDKSADYTIAAALFLAAEETQRARQAAALAHHLDPTNCVATVVLADVLRLAGEAEDAISLLGPLRGVLTPDSDVGASIVRTLARALELGGRRKDALEAVEQVLDRPDVLSEDLVFAGGLHSAQGDFDKARAAFDRALEVDPDELPVIYTSVVHWLRAKHQDRAVIDVERALRRRPENPYLHILLGYVSGHAERRSSLAEEIERAIALGMDHADAWSWASSLFEDQGDRRSAADALARALKLRTNDPELLARRGQLLIELGEYDHAVQLLRRAVKYRPGDAGLHRRLAEALLAAEQPQEALIILNRAVRKLPHSGALFAARGQVHRRLGDLPAANRDLRRSLEYEQTPAWAAELFRVLRDLRDEPAAAALLAGYMNRGVGALAAELWNAGDHTGALAIVDVGLEQSVTPRSDLERAKLLTIRGLGEWQLTGRGDPEKSFRQALAMYPQYSSAHVFLGTYLVQKGRSEEAAAEALTARALDPGSVHVALVAVNVLRNASGDLRALEELDDAVRQIGEDPELLTLRVVLLAALDLAEDALALVSELRETGVADPRLLFAEGTSLSALGRYSEAANVLGVALKEYPEDVEVRLNLAYVLNSIGEAERAAAVLEGVSRDAFDARILFVRGKIRHALREKGCLDDFGEAIERDPLMAAARMELVDAAFEFGQYVLARRHLMVLMEDSRLQDNPQLIRLAWLLDEHDLALERADSILNTAKIEKRSMSDVVCETLVYKSAILLELGKVTPAVNAARSAVKLDGKNWQARYVLSAALKAAGSLEEALTALGRGNDPQLISERVRLLLEIDDRSREAVRLVRDFVQARSSDQAVTSELLDELVRHGLLLQTARMLGLRLSSGPSPLILRSAGRLLSAMGDFQRAVGVLELARRRDRELSGVDADLAWAYSNLTPPRPRAALTAANRALRQTPDDLYLLRTKADALLEMDRAPQARRLYEHVRDVLATGPPSPDDGSLAGWCSYRLGEYERALDHLLRAISTSARPDPANRFDLALVLLVACRPSRAKHEFATAIEEGRGVPSPLQRHGILQVALVDLGDVLAKGSVGLNFTVATRLETTLRRELKSTRSSFGPAQSFLGKVEDLLSAPSRRTGNAGL